MGQKKKERERKGILSVTSANSSFFSRPCGALEKRGEKGKKGTFLFSTLSLFTLLSYKREKKEGRSSVINFRCSSFRGHDQTRKKGRKEKGRKTRAAPLTPLSSIQRAQREGEEGEKRHRLKHLLGVVGGREEKGHEQPLLSHSSYVLFPRPVLVREEKKGGKKRKGKRTPLVQVPRSVLSICRLCRERGGRGGRERRKTLSRTEKEKKGGKERFLPTLLPYAAQVVLREGRKGRELAFSVFLAYSATRRERGGGKKSIPFLPLLDLLQESREEGGKKKKGRLYSHFPFILYLLSVYPVYAEGGKGEGKEKKKKHSSFLLSLHR